VAELGALVDGGHEAGAPVAVAAGRLVGIVEQDDIAGQLLIFGAEAVEGPGTERRPTGEYAAGIHLANAADVVQAIGGAAAEDGEVVDTAGDFRIPIADPRAGVAMLAETALAAEEIGVGGPAHRSDGSREAAGKRLTGQL